MYYATNIVFYHVFEMLFSYLITEMLILVCFYLDRQFRYRLFLKYLEWYRNGEVQISTERVERKKIKS